MKFSKKPIMDGLEAVLHVRQEWERLETEKAALTVPDPILDGARAIAEHRAKVYALDEQERAAVAAALEAVQRARSAWDTVVTEAFTPHGTDTAEPDFKLLELGIVDTPDELRRVLSRHTDSVVFQRQAGQYAAARNWEGFSETWNGGAVEAFAADAFDAMERAAKTPFGYFAMLAAEPGFLQGLAVDHGCAAEWNQADE